MVGAKPSVEKQKAADDGVMTPSMPSNKGKLASILIRDQHQDKSAPAGADCPVPDGIEIPEKSLSDWGIAFLLFVSSLLYLWPFRDYVALNADEGIVLQGAERILQGEVLYRDFFSFLTPGSYYEAALLFKIFGSSLLVGRTTLVVYGGLFSVLTYLLARRVCSRWSALFSAYLLLITCLPYRFVILHNWDSTLYAFLTLYCAVWLLQAPQWIWAFGTGSFMAFTFLFEQSKGAGVMFGVLLGYLIMACGNFRGRLLRPPHLFSMLAGLMWPFLLTAAYFLSRHSLSQMLGGWLWPLQHYSAANRLPYATITMSSESWEALYGNPSWIRRVFYVLLSSPCFIIPVLPVIALGIMAFHAIEDWTKKQRGMASSYYLLVCAIVLGSVLSTVATGRPDLTHIMYLAPPLFLVLAWIVDGRSIPFPFLDNTKPLLVVYLLIFFTAFGMVLLWQPLNAHQQQETRRGLLRVSSSDPTLAYIQAHVPAGEKMLVYPYQPLYNFLTATFSPTRYEYLQPGLHTPAQFQEVISQLTADQTPVVLYELTFSSEKIPEAWPATPVDALASDPVRDFIFSHYHPCQALTSGYWHFVFMVRRDLTCPGGSGSR